MAYNTVTKRNHEGYMDTTPYEAMKKDVNHYFRGDIFTMKSYRRMDRVLILSGDHRETMPIQSVDIDVDLEEVAELRAEAKIYKQLYSDLLAKVMR